MMKHPYGPMNILRLVLVPLTLGLLLAACGGGGGGGSSGNGDDNKSGMPPADEPVPTLADIYSSATAVEHSFDAISASVQRNITANNTSIPDSDDTELSVSSIRRNAGGGYDITYHIDEAMRTVSFLPEHCGEDSCERTIGEGEEAIDYEFWTMFSPAEGGGPLDLTTDREYSSVGHFTTGGTITEEQNISHRQMFVFGIETPAAAMPSRGEAIYNGWFRADTYRQNSASSDHRQRFIASMQIVANFDMSSLDGEIVSVRGTQPGQGNSDRVPWPTSRFRITDGEINKEGQFTATLIGMDSDSSVPDNESIRGLVGEVVGRFFGPNAEELGGAVSASRNLDGDDNDLNLYGYVSASRFGPSRPLGSAAMAYGISRNYETNTTELLEEASMTTVERTDGGWRIHVDGRTVELRDREDYGSMSDGYYTRDMDNDRAWFWSATHWRFAGDPEFDHFDVKGWAFEDRENPEDSAMVIANRHLVHGNRTLASAIPSSGTAIYEGRLFAWELRSDQALESLVQSGIYGDVRLNADFGASTLTGSFDGLERRTGSSGTRTPAMGGASFSAAVNAAGGFTASDLTGTGYLTGYRSGNVTGAFFGPSAEEAAGVFNAANPSSNRIMSGWFGTGREDQ